MTDNTYSRQESLGIIQDQTVLVVGCGGIGSWCGYFLGLAGVRQLELFDGDLIEGHNLNRLPFDSAAIGLPKSIALAGLIRRARPDVTINAHGHFDPEWHSEAIRSANRVIVSTDSLRSRRMVYEAVGRAGGHYHGRYVELGADGHGLTVTGSPAEWSTEAENEPGYASVPVHVGPCTMAASIAIYYILLGLPVRDTFRVDWSDSGLRVNQYVAV
jgi:hypothetical protein